MLLPSSMKSYYAQIYIFILLFISFLSCAVETEPLTTNCRTCTIILLCLGKWLEDCCGLWLQTRGTKPDKQPYSFVISTLIFHWQHDSNMEVGHECCTGVLAAPWLTGWLTDWLIDWLAENGVWFEPNSSKSNCNHLLLVPFLSGALMALALLADPRLTGHWSGRDRAEFRRALCKPSPWTNQGPETPVNWLRQSRTH